MKLRSPSASFITEHTKATFTLAKILLATCWQRGGDQWLQPHCHDVAKTLQKVWNSLCVWLDLPRTDASLTPQWQHGKDIATWWQHRRDTWKLHGKAVQTFALYWRQVVTQFQHDGNVVWTRWWNFKDCTCNLALIVNDRQYVAFLRQWLPNHGDACRLFLTV